MRLKALESNELSVEYNKAGFEVGTRSTNRCSSIIKRII